MSAEEKVVRHRRTLAIGDRLVGRPCEVTITTMNTVVAWGKCSTCREGHIIERVLFEAGRGPWRKEEVNGG